MVIGASIAVLVARRSSPEEHIPLVVIDADEEHIPLVVIDVESPEEPIEEEVRP